MFPSYHSYLSQGSERSQRIHLVVAADSAPIVTWSANYLLSEALPGVSTLDSCQQAAHVKFRDFQPHFEPAQRHRDAMQASRVFDAGPMKRQLDL